MLIPPPNPSTGSDAQRDPGADSFPDNPILVRQRRGESVESVHRGAWALVDAAGKVIESVGAIDFPIYARSSTKALQALPLFESGAAERYRFGTRDIALAIASHSAELCHTEVVASVLRRLELGVGDLQCGSQRPADPGAQRTLDQNGDEPSAIHNNCSGKHAGFLALTLHLGDDVSRYLDPDCRSQRLVRAALMDMTGVAPRDLSVAVDGCSAPTFRLPLRDLATAFARFTSPSGLEPERRGACQAMMQAVALHPELIAGNHRKICTDIARVSAGRLFPKVGAEAVYVLGEQGGERALALKMDDGAGRGMHALLLHLMRRFGLAKANELEALESWSGNPVRNWAGLEVGRMEIVD